MILASNSQRRYDILNEMGFKFKVIIPNIEENSDKKIVVEKVKEIAYKKAMYIAKENPKDFVLAADTIVEIDNEILGKPKDDIEAKNYLKKLSGKTHRVITAYSFINLEKNIFICDFDSSEIEFYNLNEKDIEWYLSTQEPFDKAGAYAIQGKGRIFVKNIKGNYFSIVGFPIAKFMRNLQELGYSINDIDKI